MGGHLILYAKEGMQRHFVQELEELRTRLVRMGSLVERAVADALRGLFNRDIEAAQSVLRQENEINAFEIEIDESVVDLLALHQPVATDLRFILAGMKINNDLERLGDHAVNIAESAISCAGRPPIPIPPDIPRMAEITREMMKSALDSFIHSTPALSRDVLALDDTIDEMNRRVARHLADAIRSSPDSVEQALDLMRVSRNLERIADLTTNIAEEVIYVAEAQVVKHQTDRKEPSR